MRTAHALPIAAAIAVATAHAAAAADRLAPAAGQGQVAVTITVGGKTYSGSGRGRCESHSNASIYGAPAALYQAMYDGGDANARGLKNVSVTAWKPARGDGMMSLYAMVGSSMHRVDTVKRPGGKGTAGSGTITIRQQGLGGRFDFDGRDDTGTAIRGSISCARFDHSEPVAG
jgi:hypothetical protein